MNCDHCNCALIETEMTFEFEYEDGGDIHNYRICLGCVDDTIKCEEAKIIAVWKFGTSIEVDEDEEFDMADYKDHMFASDETTSEPEPEPEPEFEFEKLGIDTLIDIFALWKRKMTNMKSSRIPLEKRRTHIIDAIKKIMKDSPDEKNIEIIKTYFAPKAPAEKKGKDPELSNYKVGDIVLCDAGKYRNIWTPAKVRKINEKSITIQFDEYRRIDDLDAIRNQTYGKDRLVWLNCFGGAKKVIADSKNIWSKSDCETRYKGDMSYLLRYFDEGEVRVDFGN